MAFFQGENIAFKIVLKDDNGDAILASTVEDIYFDLYLESTLKKYAKYMYDSGSGIGDDDEPIVKSTDDSGFEFEIESDLSEVLDPGRYIMQLTFETEDFSFDDNRKVTTQKGALITVRKRV